MVMSDSHIAESVENGTRMWHISSERDPTAAGIIGL